MSKYHYLRKCHVSFFAWSSETRSTIKVLFYISYRTRTPESESEPESIRSPESDPESELEQPHHDTAPLLIRIKKHQKIICILFVKNYLDFC